MQVSSSTIRPRDRRAAAGCVGVGVGDGGGREQRGIRQSDSQLGDGRVAGFDFDGEMARALVTISRSLQPALCVVDLCQAAGQLQAIIALDEQTTTILYNTMQSRRRWAALPTAQPLQAPQSPAFPFDQLPGLTVRQGHSTVAPGATMCSPGSSLAGCSRLQSKIAAQQIASLVLRPLAAPPTCRRNHHEGAEEDHEERLHRAFPFDHNPSPQICECHPPTHCHESAPIRQRV